MPTTAREAKKRPSSTPGCSHQNQNPNQKTTALRFNLDFPIKTSWGVQITKLARPGCSQHRHLPQWRTSSHQGAYNNLRPLLIRQPRPPAAATEPRLKALSTGCATFYWGPLSVAYTPRPTPRTDLTPPSLPPPAPSPPAISAPSNFSCACVLLVLWFCALHPAQRADLIDSIACSNL
jgi:hypothetical protein